MRLLFKSLSRVLVFSLRIPEFLVRPIILSVLQQKTMLYNHPVLLLAHQVVGDVPGNQQSNILSISDAQQALKTEPLRSLLVQERIRAIDVVLTGRNNDTKHDGFLDWDLSDRKLAIVAMLNDTASRAVGDTRLQLTTALSFAERATRAGFFDNATEAFGRAFDAACLAGNDAAAVRSLYSLGQLRYRRGDIDGALHDLSRATSWTSRPKAELTKVLLFLSEIHAARGEFGEAEEYAKQAISSESIWLGNDSVSAAQRQLGEQYLLQGRITESAEAFSCASELGDKLALEELYRLYLRRGDLDSAREIISKFPDDGIVGVSMDFVLAAFARLGHLRHWLIVEREALERHKHSGDEEAVLLSYRRLCVISGQLRNGDDVRDCFNSAIEVANRSEQKIGTGHLLKDYAEALSRCGIYADAMQTIAQAIAIFSSLGLHVAETESLLIRGNAELEQGLFKEADATFQDARSLGRELELPDYELEALLRLVESSLLRKASDVDSEHLDRAMTLARDGENVTGQARILLAKANLLIGKEERDRADTAKAISLLEEAAQLILRTERMDLQRVVLERLGWCYEFQIEEKNYAAARSYYKRAVDCYFQERMSLPPIQSEAVGTPSRNRLLQVSQIAFDNSIRLAEAENDVSEVVRLSELRRAQTLCEWISRDNSYTSKINSSQSNVAYVPGHREAILHFTWFHDRTDAGDRLLLVVIFSEGDHHLIRLETKGIECALEEFECLLSEVTSGLKASGGSLTSIFDSKKAFIISLMQLSRYFLPSQVMELLMNSGVDRLVIIPDKNLNQIPFPALINIRTKRHIIEEYEVVLAPSIEVLAASRQRESQTATPVLLGVAQPIGSDLAASGDGKFVRDRILGHFSEESHLLMGARASARDFVDLAPQADVIHLMLHGSSHSSRRANAPSLEFAGVDGLFPGEQFSSDTLFRLVKNGKRFPRCQLLTMNVCFSAEMSRPGDYTRTDISGFPAAILSLGVPAFIGARWLLYSKPGQIFFEKFYMCLREEGLAVGASFRAAVLEVKNYKGPDADWDVPFFDHPYFWSGLMLIGDGGRSFAT
ncbi:CHAT domain-containing protein [Gimesia aquarii]|uniref:CHAT domain protein n=1 Tax=Gimesia aquarii TaxID=2527964 RepID=A0A517X198_9PLAN|nr:CHAT domain-containing protein [Gimesia aquarii]QDU11274.1 CHAT domain protein [Gimesia aquarii]